jgi:hypothetical protein
MVITIQLQNKDASLTSIVPFAQLIFQDIDHICVCMKNKPVSNFGKIASK